MHTEIKKIVHPVIAVQPVVSSQITAIGHSVPLQTLAVEFPADKQGNINTYHYQNVTAEKFEEFKAAESIGSYFGKTFKGKVDDYPYVKAHTRNVEDK